MVLPPELQQQEPFDVHLFEARPGDPNVPQGKAFAVLQLHDLGYIEEGVVPASTVPFPLCGGR